MGRPIKMHIFSSYNCAAIQDKLAQSYIMLMKLQRVKNVQFF